MKEFAQQALKETSLRKRLNYQNIHVLLPMQKGEKSLDYKIFLVIATIIIIIFIGGFLILPRCTRKYLILQPQDLTCFSPYTCSSITASKLDGSDETVRLQSALNYAKSNGYTAVSFPNEGKTVGISYSDLHPRKYGNHRK